MLILISSVLAYPSGIVAVRRLGSSLASFVSLTEVIFAVSFAFVLLGQRPGPMQLLGGALILAGIALVQRPARPKVVAERLLGPCAATAESRDCGLSLRASSVANSRGAQGLPKSVTSHTLSCTESLITSMPTWT